MKFDRHKLEALLDRVRHNTGLPRVAAAAPPSMRAAPRASTPALDLDEPGLDSLSPPGQGGRPADDLDLDEPPESGRSRVRGAELTDDEGDGRPPLTPPPESGEEPAPKVSIPRDPGPTMAQLGQTIALEEAAGGALELDEPPAPQSRRGIDQLAMDLPQAGAYSEELPLPENAREELDRVRLGQSTEVGPTVHSRPVLSTNVVDFVSAVRSYQPETFLDLLDASLRL